MRDRISPSVESVLRPYLESTERTDHTVCALDPAYRIAYVNPAWERFATDNGGQPAVRHRWSLGAHYLDAASDFLRVFYTNLLESSVQIRSTDALRPVTHEYECSSATFYRRFAMSIYALPGQVYLISHAPVIERPHALDLETFEPGDVYFDSAGIVTQCAHCRRVQRARQLHNWDWVPAWVARSPRGASHGICPACMHYYFPAELDAAG